MGKKTRRFKSHFGKWQNLSNVYVKRLTSNRRLPLAVDVKRVLLNFLITTTPGLFRS